MSYIPALPLESVSPAVRGSLEAVQQKLGVLPNMFTTSDRSTFQQVIEFDR